MQAIPIYIYIGAPNACCAAFRNPQACVGNVTAAGQHATAADSTQINAAECAPTIYMYKATFKSKNALMLQERAKIWFTAPHSCW